MNKLKVTFAGGAVTPTGSNFLLDYDGVRILVDCGLYQGGYQAHLENRKDFTYDASSIDYLFITHGHLDHVGRIAKLVRAGFAGKIYSTAPTRDIGELIMLDSMRIINREHESEGIPPIYEEKDVVATMSMWTPLKYHEVLSIKDGLSVRLKDAGHIMGSSMIEFTVNGKKIIFTGDLGNTPSPLLRDTESLEGADYLFIESVYGDRNHEHKDHRVEKLKEIMLSTIKRGGTLMIPAFSVERTQELLYHMNEMIENGEIPRVKIYLDSPLGIKVTQVYKKYAKDFMNTEVNSIIKSGDDIFNFKGLVITESKEDSKAINDDKGAKIIIAGSGMSNGGRIMHHEMHYLSDPKSTLLMVGYQAVGTLGRQLQEGAKVVRIFGEEVRVKCNLENIGGFSAHKDSDNLLKLVETGAATLKKVFVILGEPRSQMFLGQKIHEHYGLEVKIPTAGEVVEIEV
jgi:metallo-beta-lactamase family protein